jgi:hypothetical protein
LEVDTAPPNGGAVTWLVVALRGDSDTTFV